MSSTTISGLAASLLRTARHEVLVVDDDSRCARLVGAALAPLGLGVRFAELGRQGLEQCLLAPPDLVVVDLDLPDLSGFDLVADLRAQAITARLPVLVLSGHGDAQSRVAAFGSGADCFLSKPFEVEELRAVVASLALRGRVQHDLEPGCSVLLALAEIVDLRCLDARGHMERCARLARGFGEVLQLDGSDLLALERAGYLHDIGKVGVPITILNKPGQLAPAERLAMQEHPVVGARICEHLATLRRVVPIVRHHHERWDGSGYPDGLSGEAIPLLARVFQVVDVFEALISRRCYKAALPPQRALEILQEEAAQGAWDATLVGAFAHSVGSGRLAAALADGTAAR